MGLVRDLAKRGLKVKEVYVDTVGPPEKYQRKLEALFTGAKITVSKKADSLFAIVSAASICAKVIRDHRMKTWSFKERNLTAATTTFGSGYPAGAPSLSMSGVYISYNCRPRHQDVAASKSRAIRFSWKTTDNLLKGAVRVEWLTEQQQQAQLAAEGGGDGSDEDAPPLKRARKKPALARAPFFSSRGIEVCEGFDS